LFINPKGINILIVRFVRKSIDIPILWNNFDKRGNSNTAERIEIINRVIVHM